MNHGGLDRLLRRISLAVLLNELARSVCAAAALLLALALIVVAVDAALSLPSWALVIADALLCLATALAAAWVLRCLWRNRYRPRRVARHIELRLGISDSRLINAVDLSTGNGGESSESLRKLAVSGGLRRAATIEPRQVADRIALRRRAGQSAAVVAVALAALLLAPGVFRAVVPRLLDPLGNLPPYTTLKFDVQIEPETLFRNRPARITVVLGGPAVLPDRADIVFLDENDKARAIPMSRVEKGVFTLGLDRPDRSRWFYVDTPAGRSGKYQLVVHEVPTFERVVAHFQFPRYTRWEDSSVVLGRDQRTIRALVGTKVRLSVESNQPLASGEMTISAGESTGTSSVRLSPVPDHPARVEGEFVLGESGRYAISLTAQSGASGDEAFQGNLSAIADEPPSVDIAEPAPMLVAPRTSSVNVRVRAADDVRIERLCLLRSVNGWGPYRSDLTRQGPPERATGQYSFDLSVLGAEPGDVITYYAVAYDGRQPGQSSESSVHVIRVISEEEYTRQQQALVRMEELAEEMAKFYRQMRELNTMRTSLKESYDQLRREVDSNGGQWSDSHKQQLAELESRREEYVHRMRELAAKMRERADRPPVWDEVERQLAETLRSQADALEAHATDHEAVRNRLADATAGGLNSAQADGFLSDIRNLLGTGHDDGQLRLAQTQRDLERAAKADRMLAMIQQLQMVVEQQRELANRLAEFRNREQLSPAGQMRAQRMGREQALLREELSHLLLQMRRTADDSAQDLPRMSASIAELCDAIDQLDVTGDQADAATLASAGQGRYAHRAAESAAQKLESLCSSCIGGGGEQIAAGDLDRMLGLQKQSLSELIKDLQASRRPIGSGFGAGYGEGTGGYYGSRAPWQLAGQSRGGSGFDEGMDLAAGRGAGPGDARSAGTNNDLRPGGESVLPEAGPQRSYAPVMIGVPPQYRDLAEAYFRRLADESR